MGIYLSGSEKDTKQLAAKLLERYQNNLERRALLFALHGELGAGKTTFAKGIGEYLGIKRTVRSPGYVLVTEYSHLGGKVFHIDLWRIESEDEARALKIEEMIKPGNIILIEWAQKIPKFLKELGKRNDLKVVEVRFKHKGKDKRELRIFN